MLVVYHIEDKRYSGNCKIMTREVESLENAKAFISTLPQSRLFGDSCRVYSGENGIGGYESEEYIFYSDVFNNFKAR